MRVARFLCNAPVRTIRCLAAAVVLACALVGAAMACVQEKKRQGVGAALVCVVCAWAAQAGHRSLTLTTFRHLPWNMPFYTRLGFKEVPSESLSADLLATVRDETARGLDPRLVR